MSSFSASDKAGLTTRTLEDGCRAAADAATCLRRPITTSHDMTALEWTGTAASGESGVSFWSSNGPSRAKPYVLQ